VRRLELPLEEGSAAGLAVKFVVPLTAHIMMTIIAGNVTTEKWLAVNVGMEEDRMTIQIAGSVRA
jgi:hypothetical protein